MVNKTNKYQNQCLCGKSRCSLSRVLPVWSKNSLDLVVPGEPVDPGLDKDESVLAINIVARPVEVLPDVSSLLDQEIEFLWEGWSETVSLKDALDLVASDRLDLANTVLVTKESADLGWADTLLGVVADELDNVLSAELEPVWGSAPVWSSGSRDTLALGVETTHVKRPTTTAKPICDYLNVNGQNDRITIMSMSSSKGNVLF